MKLRISDRILVALAGLIILACCTGLVMQAFFGVDVILTIQKYLIKTSLKAKIIYAFIAAVFLLLGIYCVMVLFRHRRGKDKFVVQKTDNGELAISVKALESLVVKCLEQHRELNVQGIRLENQRDGLLVTVKGNVAGGISIPLTIEALQRQVKQYVTACSGVEVKGIRVLIESSGDDAQDAPFAIEAPSAKPLLKSADNTDINDSDKTDSNNSDTEHTVQEKEKEPEQKHPTDQPAIITDSFTVQDDDDDNRPLHQRLFSSQNEPCIVPMPPADDQQAMNQLNTDDESIFTTEKRIDGENTVEGLTDDGVFTSKDAVSEDKNTSEQEEIQNLSTDQNQANTSEGIAEEE